ncbi:hypothetical protein [Radiobacillus sp. PE A8.2]|uniref:hypothetical protein n=1 Tax=Radiobacillus sp. PE A8.2 TaxID=3380349 RepID=UPI00388DA7B5
MVNLDALLEQFLHDQQNSLKTRTFREYDEVIYFFKIYLNSYAYLYLDEEEMKEWELEFNEDEDCFTRLFGAEQLNTGTFGQFLNSFVTRKIGGEAFMKKSIRVMKKLAKWLYENNYIDTTSYHDFQYYFGEVKELPKAEKLANLLIKQVQQAPERNYTEVIDGVFLVEEVRDGKLLLQDEFGEVTDIIPVKVTKQIADLCEKGWSINLALGKVKDHWYIIESGNVYPY